MFACMYLFPPLQTLEFEIKQITFSKKSIHISRPDTFSFLREPGDLFYPCLHEVARDHLVVTKVDHANSVLLAQI